MKDVNDKMTYLVEFASMKLLKNLDSSHIKMFYDISNEKSYLLGHFVYK